MLAVGCLREDVEGIAERAPHAEGLREEDGHIRRVSGSGGDGDDSGEGGSGDGDSLPRTGAGTAGALTVGLVLTGIGLVLLLRTRRPRA